MTPVEARASGSLPFKGPGGSANIRQKGMGTGLARAAERLRRAESCGAPTNCVARGEATPHV